MHQCHKPYHTSSCHTSQYHTSICHLASVFVPPTKIRVYEQMAQGGLRLTHICSISISFHPRIIESKTSHLVTINQLQNQKS